eukprot:COSAG06_NODE_58573_length_276_cov_1.435028_1_plen_59_part_10
MCTADKRNEIENHAVVSFVFDFSEPRLSRACLGKCTFHILQRKKGRRFSAVSLTGAEVQ